MASSIHLFASGTLVFCCFVELARDDDAGAALVQFLMEPMGVNCLVAYWKRLEVRDRGAGLDLHLLQRRAFLVQEV